MERQSPIKVDERECVRLPRTMKLTVLLLDTETNGLPKNRYAPISEPGAYPAILQLSWSTFTVTGRTLKSETSRDIGVALHSSEAWDTGAAKIHGLTEVEARGGTPAAEALLELRTALQEVDVVIAHNLSFDKSVIRAAGYTESLRHPEQAAGLRSIWPLPSEIKEFCTMKTTRDMVRIPATAKQAQYADLGRFKAPKLNELYAWLYGHVYDISGATLHSAKSDTHCLAQCLAGLLRKGLVEVFEDTKALRLSASGLAATVSLDSPSETL